MRSKLVRVIHADLVTLDAVLFAVYFSQKIASYFIKKIYIIFYLEFPVLNPCQSPV